MFPLVLSLGFAGFVAYVAQPGSTLFSWHPTLMSLAFMVFIVQAVRSLSPDGIYGNGKNVTFHWLLLLGGIVAALLGFSAVYFTKEKFGKPHLTTPHGQLGCFVLGYLLIQSCAGINVLFPALVKKFVPYGQLKRMHGFSGVFLLLLATLVLLGGITSDWFKERVQGIPWFMCVAIPLILWGFLLNQVLQSKPPAKKAGKTQ